MVEPTPIVPVPIGCPGETSEYPHHFVGLPRICSRCDEHEEGLLESNRDCPVRKSEMETGQLRVQLVVQMMDGTTRFYPMTKGEKRSGWKIDPTNRTLVIGSGFGRIIMPLDNIESMSPQTY